MSLDRRQGVFGGALALLLVFALLAAGCGGGDDGSSSGESGASNGPGEAAGAAGVERAEEFGSEVSGSEAKGPEAALHGYLDARANGEWSKACSYLSKELRKFYERISKKTGCATFVKKTTERFSANEREALSEIEVDSVRLEGTRGYVIYANARGSQQTRPVEREDGAWKVSSQIVQLLGKAKKQ